MTHTLDLEENRKRPNAANFFLNTVAPTVSEFEMNPLDIRRARLAVIVLYHMVDYFALDGFTSRDRNQMDKQVRNARLMIKKQCSEFALIWDIADASKHDKLAIPQDNKSLRQLTSAEQVSSHPGLGLLEESFGEGLFAEAVGVIATLDDGSIHPLLPAVRAVMSTWRDVMNEYA